MSEEEDEYLLLELDQFQVFLQTMAEEEKAVTLHGLDGPMDHVSLSVQGAEFQGSVEPIVGTALLFENGSTIPTPVSRKIVLRPTKRQRGDEDDDDQDK